MNRKVLAWHFTNGMKLRDGQELVVGKTYKHTGSLEMCNTGYHASVDIRDALSYAPGFMVSSVECSGEMIEGDDKLVCSERKVLWSFDAKDVILKWSIRVATDAVKTAKKVCKDKAWNTWADSWISGKDRSYYAAAYAADEADAEAYAASAAYVASYAAYAADAARASYAAYAASAAYAADEARKKYSSWLIFMIEKARKEE